ncbi:MAG: FtsX-like permease family protein, partial [Bacteroidota bacterium]
ISMFSLMKNSCSPLKSLSSTSFTVQTALQSWSSVTDFQAIIVAQAIIRGDLLIFPLHHSTENSIFAPMNLPYFIARKVATSGQQSFSRLIIRIAITAIALSVTVMIVATALIAGFKNQISSKIFGFWGHIHITSTNVTRTFEAYPIARQQDFYESLDSVGHILYEGQAELMGFDLNYKRQLQTKGGINHVQVFAHKPGIIKTKTDIEGIILKGISTDFKWENLEQYLIEGRGIAFSDSTKSRDIIISDQTSKRMKLKVDDQFIIHFIENGKQIRRRLKVCGIYKTGLEEYDKKFALVDIRLLQDVLGWNEDQVGGFEVFIDHIDDLDPINEYIYYEVIPNDLYSQSIKDKFGSIFEWLALQDINELVILILITIVSIINMVTALMILILERTNMIGILKALGSPNWSIRKIFLYHAAYIIGLGILLGNLIGLSLCILQDRFQFIKLSEADYYLSVAPVEINLWTILLLNLGTLLITLLFLIIPSYLVTRIHPVQAIRFK